jgi:arylsulfatase A-like enzyme
MMKIKGQVFLNILLLILAGPKTILAQSQESKTHLKEKTNIILISIDTLRQNHLGCYGYHRQTSPNIDRLAQDGILFSNAFSQWPCTAISHASILTGLYPHTHGMRYYFDFDNPQNINYSSLRAEIVTLAEVLKENKYITLGFVRKGIGLDPPQGFAQGFDIYHSLELPAERLNQNIFSTVNRLKKRPFFLFLHYYDVHSTTGKLAYEGRGFFSGLFSKKSQPDFKIGRENLSASRYLARMNSQNSSISPDELQHIVDLYDEAVAYVDNAVGEFLSYLKEKELYENSFIILFSDHGEEFREHGKFLHVQLYEEVIRIPLIIKFPYNAKKQDKYGELVESIDIMPTVLDYLRIGAPEIVEGKSLIPLIEGRGEGKKEVFARTFDSGMVRTEKWKMILQTNRIQLFDLSKDTQEQHNLFLSNINIAAKLFRDFLSWCNGPEYFPDDRIKQTNALLNERQIEKLGALGYLD